MSLRSRSLRERALWYAVEAETTSGRGAAHVRGANGHVRAGFFAAVGRLSLRERNPFRGAKGDHLGSGVWSLR